VIGLKQTATWNGDNDTDTRHVTTSTQKTSKSADIKRSVTVTKCRWDTSTDLIYAPNGKINLKEQQSHIRDIISKTITALLRSLVLQDAYPEGNKGTDELQGHTGLFAKEAAEELGYKMVADRIANDHKYRDGFTRIVRQSLT
jgi:hypothetical protein